MLEDSSPRSRCHTWPKRQMCIESTSQSPSTAGMTQNSSRDSSKVVEIENKPKPTSSRRNPWGNCSYAELITQAIQSSHEKRLTLAQIYDWVVKNVPYFNGKGDNISSIGWKVSTKLRRIFQYTVVHADSGQRLIRFDA